MKSILIKDTTKKEREKIVADALGCGSDCSICKVEFAVLKW